MARQTLQQITGTYGLPVDASGNPFADQEATALDLARRATKQMVSNSLELDTARGMGRSTFHDQARMLQEENIYAKTLADSQKSKTDLFGNLIQLEAKGGIEGELKNLEYGLAKDKLIYETNLKEAQTNQNILNNILMTLMGKALTNDGNVLGNLGQALIPKT